MGNLNKAISNKLKEAEQELEMPKPDLNKVHNKIRVARSYAEQDLDAALHKSVIEPGPIVIDDEAQWDEGNAKESLLTRIKEFGRRIFGSNYNGHRRACIAGALVLAIPFLFFVPWFAFIIGGFLASKVNLAMEFRDKTLPGNSFNSSDVYGGYHGSAEGAIIGTLIVALDYITFGLL